MNKKAQLSGMLEIVMAIVMIAVFSLVLFMGSHATQIMVDKFSHSAINNTDAGHDALTKAQRTINIIDVVFIVAAIAFIMGFLFVCFTSNFHPAVIIAFIILGVITIFIAIPFSNAYQKMSGLSSLSSTAAKLPMMGEIMNNLPIIIGVIAAIGIIVLYAKSGGGGSVQ